MLPKAVGDRSRSRNAADYSGEPVAQLPADVPGGVLTRLKLLYMNAQLRLAAYVRNWVEHAL